MARLKDKVVVILGASGQNSMGAATARRLAKEGAKLVVAARRKDRLDDLVQELGGIAVACDITRESDIEQLAQTAVERFGRLDAAINYAGTNAAAPIVDITEEMLQQCAAVHFVGTALFFKHMARQMKDGGSLVTTSSLTALVAPPGLAAYAGSKKGADQVVRIAAVELGPLGIRVNSIAPGFMRSEMTEGYFAIPTLEGAFKREIPLGRLGTVEDVANAALWLVSDEAASTTGQLIDLTSGQSLRRTPTAEEMAR